MENGTDGMLVLITNVQQVLENDEIDTRITEATNVSLVTSDPHQRDAKRKRINMSITAYDTNDMNPHLTQNSKYMHERELFSISTSWSAKYPETVMKFGPLHEDNPAGIIMNNKQHEAFFKGLAKKVTDDVRSGKTSIDKLMDFKFRDNGLTIPGMHSFKRSAPKLIDKTTKYYHKDHNIMTTIIDHLGKVADGQLNFLDFYEAIEGKVELAFITELGNYLPSMDNAYGDVSELLGTALTHGLGDENILDTTMDVFKEAMAVSPTKIGGRNKQSPDDIIKAYTADGTLGQTAVRLRALRSGSSHQPALVRGLYNKMC